jgi:hypothetical protein
MLSVLAIVGCPLLDTLSSDLYHRSHVSHLIMLILEIDVKFLLLSSHSEAKVQRSIFINPEIVQILLEYHQKRHPDRLGESHSDLGQTADGSRERPRLVQIISRANLTQPGNCRWTNRAL